MFLEAVHRSPMKELYQPKWMGRGEEHHRSDLWEDTPKRWVKTPQMLSQPLGHCRWMSDRCGASLPAAKQAWKIASLAYLQLLIIVSYHIFFRLFLAWIISVKYLTAWHHKPLSWHWGAVKHTRGKGPKIHLFKICSTTNIRTTCRHISWMQLNKKLN